MKNLQQPTDHTGCAKLHQQHCLACDQPSAEQLNRDCFCQTLDRHQLDAILKTDQLNQDLLATQPQLFSNTTVFISTQQIEQMRRIIEAIERVLALPAYAEHTVRQAPTIAALNPGTAGVFMGYDFHLSADGPKIIEINSNAGGAFLNSALLKAQTTCRLAEGLTTTPQNQTFDQQVMAMFKREWQLQRGHQALTTIAIVDNQPEQQFLYAEFKMAQRLFARHAIHAVIADAKALSFDSNQLLFQGQKIDLVYNRLTDFYLKEKNCTALHQAYMAGVVVVTPNPHHHAFYADKRQLIVLGDTQTLHDIGATAADCLTLSNGIPTTQAVTLENAAQLWKNRKQLFFKPSIGFGSRAAYRGDKLTQRVWQEILQNDYVAQQQITPSERGILVDGREVRLKMDVRAYVYAGEIQLVAARLYQGQTTNFRTQGGGFAPVLVV